jgi:hypothetical protein
MSSNKELGNVRIWCVADEESAAVRLIVNVIHDDGRPAATLFSLDAPEELRAVLHAYRMGQRFPPAEILPFVLPDDEQI